MTDHLDTLKAMRKMRGYTFPDKVIINGVEIVVPDFADETAALDAAIAAMEVGRVCPICGNAAHYKCDKCGEEYFTPRQSMEHSNQRYAPELRALKERLARVREKVTGLLHDTIQAHRDPDSFDYNQCEEAECAWCEEARAVLAILNQEEP